MVKESTLRDDLRAKARQESVWYTGRQAKADVSRVEWMGRGEQR